VRVTVAYAAPGTEAIVEVTLPTAATVRDAVAASGMMTRLALDPESIAFAIFGRRVHPGAVLAEGDRIELTRPLVVDPKVARRTRGMARR
jgi:putative ubiquitin-RnfH superfamily antitoxin RatB of RatAB toxin-antitoxin module